MKAEAELIKKIQGLKSVEPRKDWVILTKKQILGEKSAAEASSKEFSFWTIFQYRYALVSLLVALAFAGTFAFAQKAVPGDFLYAFKKATEEARLTLVSAEKRPNLQLEYANARLESLVEVVQANRVRKLAPIIEEYQFSVSEAAKSLTMAHQLDLEEVVQRTREIEENRKKAESLGVIIDNTEVDNALAGIVKREIEELEEGSLSETQVGLLEEAKEEYQDGNYSDALYKIWLLSYPQER